MGSRWKKKLQTALDLARRDRGRLVQAATGRVEQYKIYLLETTGAEPTITVPDAAFRILSEEDFYTIGDPAFRAQQLKRAAILNRSTAFGVYLDGRLAHVSWLVPSSTVNREPVHILPKLHSDEAEITACETFPDFRGRNIYPFAIQKICVFARGEGIRHVYMKTSVHNKSSQSGIQKAGFAKVALASVVTPPLWPGGRLVFRLSSGPRK